MKRTAILDFPARHDADGGRVASSPCDRPTCRRLFCATLRSVPLLLLSAWLALLPAQDASAMPEFARRYNLSCAACHSAFPRLNKFGEVFIANTTAGVAVGDFDGDGHPDLLVPQSGDLLRKFTAAQRLSPTWFVD